MNHSFLLWIATAFYAAHVLEEYTYDWKNWATKTINLPVQWSDFYITNCIVITFGICCAAVGWQLPEFSLIYPALQIVNALALHILPTVRYRKFSPGLITAVVLFLPIALLIYIGAAQDGVLTASSLIISAIGGMVIMAYPIVMLKTKDRPFFTQS